MFSPFDLEGLSETEDIKSFPLLFELKLKTSRFGYPVRKSIRYVALINSFYSVKGQNISYTGP